MAEREARQRQYDYRAVGSSTHIPDVPALHGLSLFVSLFSKLCSSCSITVSLPAELQLGADC